MKTILIVISGIADKPAPYFSLDTPLATAKIPSLDLLAGRGDFSVFSSLDKKYELSYKNALLSLLGYDLAKGEPSLEELLEYGLDPKASINDFSTLRPFVLPGFSGHGVCLTPSAWVRGAAKCALLEPVDIYVPGAGDSDLLETIANLATTEILSKEFVFIYIDAPLRAAFNGDFHKKMEALEAIDKYLITPVADFVWKSDLMIHMAVTTDLQSSWLKRGPEEAKVPVLFYYNNHDWEGFPNVRFTEEEAREMDEFLYSPGQFMRYLCNFHDSKDDDLSF